MDLLLPAVAGTSGLVAAGAVFYKKIRPYFRVSVNCWFCNTNSKVPYRSKDAFVCHACQQYNGFTEDGEYNCDLPAQYCASLNSPPTRRPQSNTKRSPGGTTCVGSGSADSGPSLSLGNGLCQTCNLYQAMKAKALADFEPSDPDRYDEEVEVYEARLERLYGGLCLTCTRALKCTLGVQDSWLKPKLLHWRLQQSAAIKAFLTPLHNGLSRRCQATSTLLRLLCIATTAVLLLLLSHTATTYTPYTDGGHVQNLVQTVQQQMWEPEQAQEQVQMQEQVQEQVREQVQEGPQQNTTKDGLDMVEQVSAALANAWLQYGGGFSVSAAVMRCGRAMDEHEAGVVVVMLALLLAAVMVLGKNMLKAWDAVGCVLLVLLLSLCCWQDAELLQDHVTAQHTCYAKVALCGAAAVVVSCGLVASSRPVPAARRAGGSCGKFAADHRRNTSIDSQLSNSFNSSYDSLSNSPTNHAANGGRSPSPQVSTIHPSVFSTATSSINTTTSVGPHSVGPFNCRPVNVGPHSVSSANVDRLNVGPLSAGSLSVGPHSVGSRNALHSINVPSVGFGNMATHTPSHHLWSHNNSSACGSSAASLYNPFKPQHNGEVVTAFGMSASKGMFGDTSTAHASQYGYSSLDTSLGGLQIGKSKKAASMLNGRTVFGEGTNNSSGLRRDVLQSSKLSQNVNVIANSSCVAGGYWARSPTKSNRGGSTSKAPNSPAAFVNSQPVVPDFFPLSRSSSQSSGFVSHNGGSQLNNIPGAEPNGNLCVLEDDLERVSSVSNAAFVWNYEGCETSSQSSQNIDDDEQTLRQRNGTGYSSSKTRSANYVHGGARSVVSGITTSQYSSAASSQSQTMPGLMDLDSAVTRDDTIRALSRLSQDISDGDLSVISRKSLEALAKPSGSINYRSPWVAFILGMSVMANGFFALMLYKNSGAVEFFK